MKTVKVSSFFALLISAAIYASFGVLIRQLDKGFGEYFQITVRSVVAMVILGAILLVTKSSLRIAHKDLKRVVAFAVSFPVVVVLFTLAVLNIKIANAVLLLYGGSLFSSVLIGTLLFKERITKQKIVALVLVVIGLLVFTQAWVGITVGVGLVLGLLSGIADGITNSLRKYVKDLPRNTLLFYQYATSAVLSVTVALIMGERMVEQWAFWPTVTAVVFGILLVFLGRLLFYGLAHTDLNIATVTLATELLFSVILGLVFLSEKPAGHELLGGVIIFVASIISEFDFNRLRKKV